MTGLDKIMFRSFASILVVPWFITVECYVLPSDIPPAAVPVVIPGITPVGGGLFPNQHDTNKWAEEAWTIALRPQCSAVEFVPINRYYVPESLAVWTEDPTPCTVTFDITATPGVTTSLSFYNPDLTGQKCKHIVFSAYKINGFLADPTLDRIGSQPTATETATERTADTATPTPCLSSPAVEPTPSPSSLAEEPTPSYSSPAVEPTPGPSSPAVEPTPSPSSLAEEPTPSPSSLAEEPTPSSSSPAVEPTPGPSSPAVEPTPSPSSPAVESTPSPSSSATTQQYAEGYITPPANAYNN